MLGIFYLLLCIADGWAICNLIYPGLSRVTELAYDKRKIALSPYLLLLPAWYITGTMAVTWAAYILASIFSNTDFPLAVSDAIVMPAALCFFLTVFYFKGIRAIKITAFICKDKKDRLREILLITGIITLGAVLMWTTFYVKEDQLHIGVSVFSDFSPHIGMIRSFSYGNNFPTSYSHYAGEDIRYHFMFQFLAGNLEFLGLRIDYAFNLPSILSFISAFLLFYVLAVKITGKPAAGILSCLMFAFRSSKSLFAYLAKLPKGTDIIKNLKENTAFLGTTPNEDWGLWNLNVYCNQRHLAFGLSVMFFLLILFLPHLYGMFETLKQSGKEDIPVSRFRLLFFSRQGWRVLDYRFAIASGILLGSLSFFHGAAVIASLLILFMIAVLSERRMEFAITAAFAMALSFLQTCYFIHGRAVSPRFLFGFIAEQKTLFGVASYIDRLLGILPFVLIISFCLERSINRYLMLAFTVPLVFAFTVSLTVDVTVNHKYIMMSCILLGIFAAALLVKMLAVKSAVIRTVSILLLILLTAPGIYDFYTVINKNRTEGAIILNMDDPLTKFVRENSNSKDLFLTAGTNYAINQLVFGGAMLYEGHQYYAWSAGYDTAYRDDMVKRMYEAATPKELDALVKENKIRFIVVEYANRISNEYTVNERNISSAYECVYEDGEGDHRIAIYDTEKPLFR